MLPQQTSEVTRYTAAHIEAIVPNDDDISLARAEIPRAL